MDASLPGRRQIRQHDRFLFVHDPQCQSVSFDMDKGAAASSRKRIFGMLATEKIPFIGYHMVGYVEPLGTGFRFVPVSYQFLI
jgi:hypothetical protein